MDQRFSPFFEDDFIKHQIDVHPHDGKIPLLRYVQAEHDQIISNYKYNPTLDEAAAAILARNRANANALFEVGFKKVMRCITKALKYLYERRTYHGNLRDPDAIVVSSSKVGILKFPKVGENETEAHIKAGIKGDLTALHDVLVEVVKLLFYIEFSIIKEIENFVKELDKLSKDQTTTLDCFIDDVSWLLDSPVFYSRTECMDLMTKVHVLVVRSRVIYRAPFEKNITNSKFPRLFSWHKKASVSPDFSKILSEGVDGENLSEEDGVKKYSKSVCDMLRMYRNMEEHHTFEEGLESRAILFEKFIKTVGPITVELRDAVKTALKNQINMTLEVSSAMMAFLDSGCERNNDTEVGRAMLVWHNQYTPGGPAPAQNAPGGPAPPAPIAPPPAPIAPGQNAPGRGRGRGGPAPAQNAPGGPAPAQNAPGRGHGAHPAQNAPGGPAPAQNAPPPAPIAPGQNAPGRRRRRGR